jgi:membrane peptidoglycan carboxypeptidase
MTVRHRAPAGEHGIGPDASLPRLSLVPDELFRSRRRPGRCHRIVRRLRRAVAVGAALAALGALTLGALFLITPGVGNARELVRAQDRAHHGAYPGPRVPRRFAAALMAAQDPTSGGGRGTGPPAIAGVSLARLPGGGGQGGATIYQQLAKLLYAPGGSLAARAEQAVLGLKLDLAYTKPQIVQMYADVAYFGHGLYGLAAASCGYFGKPPARLSWAQAAMLAGLVAPGTGNPFSHPARARAHAARILSQLVTAHALTSAQASAARRQPPLPAAARPASHCPNSP